MLYEMPLVKYPPSPHSQTAHAMWGACDESDDALDKVMGKLDLTKKPEPESIAKGEKPKE